MACHHCCTQSFIGLRHHAGKSCGFWRNRNSLHIWLRECICIWLLRQFKAYFITVCSRISETFAATFTLATEPFSSQHTCARIQTWTCSQEFLGSVVHNATTSQKSMTSNGPSGDVFPTFIHTHIAWNHFLPTLLPAWPESRNCQLRPGDAGN